MFPSDVAGMHDWLLRAPHVDEGGRRERESAADAWRGLLAVHLGRAAGERPGRA